MQRFKSKKYTGVYGNKLRNGDISYSYTYKDESNRTCWVTVGKKSAGITEPYVYRLRNQTINKIRLGEDPSVKRTSRKRIRLNDLARNYFDAKEGVNKDNRRQYLKYKHHIEEKFGRKDVSNITVKDISSLQQSILAQGRAPKTVNSVIQLLSAIYNYNIKVEDMSIDNPCSRVKPLATDDQRQRFLTKEEVHLLIDNVSDNIDVLVFVKLALSTGARKGGLLNIKKKDIDFSNRTVRIYDYKRKNTYTGFFNDDLKELLLAYTKGLDANDYVIGRGAEPLHRKKIERKLRPVLNRLYNQGLDRRDTKNRVVIHTLRHTFASNLAIQGTSIFTIQKLMNHADIEHTMRYAKLAPDSGSEMVRSLYA